MYDEKNEFYISERFFWNLDEFGNLIISHKFSRKKYLHKLEWFYLYLIYQIWKYVIFNYTRLYYPEKFLEVIKRN